MQRSQSMSKDEKPQTPDPKTKVKKDDEKGGPKGPDPVRYGDWEKNGIAVDF